MSFINKVVLVTGAGSGIGKAVAIHMSKLAARLALVDINENNLEETAETCEKHSRAKVFKITADLTNDQETKRIVDETVNEYGKIDVLINCAGIYGSGDISDEDLMERFDKTLAINLRSIVSLIHCAAPVLIENKGNIVTISSISGRIPAMDTIPYNVAKAALTHFTKCIALTLSDKGVRVNTVSPGPVRTNLLVHNGMRAEESEAFWTNAGGKTPLKHTVFADDLTELVAFLASDKARSITGTDQVIDSGNCLVGTQTMPHEN